MSPRHPLRRALWLAPGLTAAALALVTGPGSRAPAPLGAAAVRVADATLPNLPSPPAPIPLSSGWQYRPDPNNVGLSQSWGQGGAPATGWTPVSLPHDFNATVTPTDDDGTTAWYETTFTGPSVSVGRSWALEFEAVRRHAQVWLNGYKIGSHDDPYVPFRLPATTLQPGSPNLLVVRVDNHRGGGFPEDWWNWGGITGPVTLVPVGRLSLDDLGVLPLLSCHLRCGRLSIRATVSSHVAERIPGAVYVDVSKPGGGLIAHWRQGIAPLDEGAARSVSFTVPLPGVPELWSPASPALYSVQVAVTTGGRTEARYRLRVGLRQVQVHGGIVYLNGRRLWLHGAAIHEDLPGVGAAVSDGAVNTIVSELRAIGANVTRAHYALSPRLLDAFDTAGILVWEQPPVDHADTQLRNGNGRSQALALLRSTLLADRDHPSVLFNSVGNELSPTPDSVPGTKAYLTAAIALARALDPAAAVALDTYCYPGYPAQSIYRRLDVLGIDSYFGWYPGPAGHSIAYLRGLRPFLAQSHRRYPRQALVVSEYGAEALYSGPASTKGTYQFQSDYVTRTLGVVDSLPYLNGSIYWTLREFAVAPGWTGGAVLPAGYTPDGLHHKGLIAYDGTAKPAYAVAQQLLAQVPAFAH